MTPVKTNAQRQAAYRQRQAHPELRLYPHPDDREAIKALAAKLARKRLTAESGAR